MFQAVSESNLYSRSLVASVNAHRVLACGLKSLFSLLLIFSIRALNRNFEDSDIQVFGQVQDFGKVKTVSSRQLAVKRKTVLAANYPLSTAYCFSESDGDTAAKGAARGVNGHEGLAVIRA